MTTQQLLILKLTERDMMERNWWCKVNVRRSRMIEILQIEILYYNLKLYQPLYLL